MLSPAKINLNLHITGKRNDGYHLLSSLVVFTEFGDDITFEPNITGDCNVHVTGPYANAVPMAGDNIILKAFQMLRKHITSNVCGVDITLQKNIPVAAGVGGGSSNAANTIRGLLDLWQVVAPENLNEILCGLGADVPVCYYGKSCVMQGIGESIAPLDIPAYYMVLANPNKSVATAEVFQNFAKNSTFSNVPDYPVFKDNKDLVDFLKESHNALMKPAISICPDIYTVLRALGKCSTDFVSMSGSGATCFALCSSKEIADSTTEFIQNLGYWAVSSKII